MRASLVLAVVEIAGIIKKPCKPAGMQGVPGVAARPPMFRSALLHHFAGKYFTLAVSVSGNKRLSVIVRPVHFWLAPPVQL